MLQHLSLSAMSVAIELGLLAAVLFAIFGIDDVLLDALRIAGVGRSRLPLVDPGQRSARRFAVFVPAWREGPTIGAMLQTLVTRWPSEPIRIYVGVYPNDLATLLAVAGIAALDQRVRIIINDAAGPTTKGACLNRLWRACIADRANGAFDAEAVLLHDAEDLVDAAELLVLADALDRADYAQIPVVPVPDSRARWIAGHYCDEFAETHQRDLPVRAALGALLPLAGVGCAFRIEALLSLANLDGPFPADSLTEDYELGIRLAAAGATGAFIRRWTLDGRLVASRGYFPAGIEQAVRQKTRWLRGIAFDGWDRLGWVGVPGQSLSGRLAGYWMLWRDRRAALAAVAILCGYTALVLALVAQASSASAVREALAGATTLLVLTGFNVVLLVWRALVRMVYVWQLYGWHQVPLALLRMPVGNILLVMTAWRGLWGHWFWRRGRPLAWDKTEHQFPAGPLMERVR